MKRKFFTRLTLLTLSLLMVFSLTAFVSSNGEDAHILPDALFDLPFELPCGCDILDYEGAKDYCLEHDPVNIKPIDIDELVERAVSQSLDQLLKMMYSDTESGYEIAIPNELDTQILPGHVLPDALFDLPFELPCGCVILDYEGSKNYCYEHDPANIKPFDIEEYTNHLREIYYDMFYELFRINDQPANHDH